MILIHKVHYHGSPLLGLLRHFTLIVTSLSSLCLNESQILYILVPLARPLAGLYRVPLFLHLLGTL